MRFVRGRAKVPGEFIGRSMASSSRWWIAARALRPSDVHPLSSPRSENQRNLFFPAARELHFQKPGAAALDHLHQQRLPTGHHGDGFAGVNVPLLPSRHRNGPDGSRRGAVERVAIGAGGQRLRFAFIKRDAPQDSSLEDSLERQGRPRGTPAHTPKSPPPRSPDSRPRTDAFRSPSRTARSRS